MRVARNLFRKRSVKWYHPGRTDNWWQNMCSNALPAEEWKKNSRLSFCKFEELVDQIGSFLEPDPDFPNYRAIDARKRLAIALYYLKDTGSLWMTANAFGIHVSTASKIYIKSAMLLLLSLNLTV